jgi:sulfur-oxidizing protein SoxZ
MAQDSIKIKAVFDEKSEAHIVKSIINHPMETGLRKDAATGQLIPAHFIREVVGEHNGKPVFNARWGTAVSRNPYLSFELRGAKAGDKLSIRWADSKGDSDSAEIVIG